MPRIDSYTNANGDYLELHANIGEKFVVLCYNAEGDLHWSKSTITTGYVDNNPSRLITRPITEEEARAEFERWR